jgi:hypothetical protein
MPSALSNRPRLLSQSHLARPSSGCSCSSLLLVLFVLAIIGFLFAIPSYVSQGLLGRQLQAELRSATQVSILEYQELNQADWTVSDVLHQGELTEAQTRSIMKLFADTPLPDSSIFSFPEAQHFKPNHCFQITLKDNATHSIHLCLKTGQVAMDQNARIATLCEHWRVELKRAFLNCGVPVRPTLYR